MRIEIKNSTILSDEERLYSHSIIIENDLIKQITPSNFDDSNFDLVINANNCLVIPGLIDIHVHGCMGIDTMDGNFDSLQTMSKYFASKGVTSFLPTTVTASSSDIDSAIKCISNFHHSGNGAKVLGLHLEGPYLDEDYKGAQLSNHLRKAKPDEYLPWLESGVVKLFTVAPEVEGVLDLIEMGRKFNVRFAVGHSQASYDQMIKAIDRGLDQATHLFNGMPSLHHRSPGIVGAVLTDKRVYAQIISDGNHIHPAVINLVLRTKGIEKTIIITDGISATGCKNGKYRLGDQLVDVKNGVARTVSGSLAGSTLTMDIAVHNVMKFSKLPFEKVIQSATIVPARSLGLDGHLGKVKPGYKADLVLLDEKLEPNKTIVDGMVVYERE